MCRIILILALLYSFPSYAQDGRFSFGSRNQGLANASLTLVDGWALFNNPGALGSLERSEAFVGYQNRYQISEFQVFGGGLVYHFPFLNIGIKYFKFGDLLYNQQLVGLCLANKIQKVSLGGGLNVIQTHIEGLTTRRVWLGEFGGMVELIPKFILGAHLFNFKHGSHHPTTMRLGISYRPLDPIMINIEIEKQVDHPQTLRTGLEYQVIKRVSIRTGIYIQTFEESSSNVFGTYGLGLNPGVFQIDYAFTGQQLGTLHEISLGYQFKSK